MGFSMPNPSEASREFIASEKRGFESLAFVGVNGI